MTTTTLQPTHNPLLANLLCMASMMIWAAGLPAADVLIPILPPLPLSAARMAMAALVLVPIWAAIEGLGALRGANWLRGLLIGGSTIGLGAFMLVLGQGMTDAVTVAVISASMPVIGIALEVVLDGRRMTIALILGLILSLIGGLMALGGRVDGFGLGWGALLCFGSVVTFTYGSRLTVTAFPALTPLGRTSVTLAGAAFASVIAATLYSGLVGPAADWSVMGPREIGALAIFAIGGLAISQLLWIMAVGSLGIGLASLHINAAPFYVMILLFALGAAWNWTQAIGAAIVGLGVLIAQGILALPRR